MAVSSSAGRSSLPLALCALPNCGAAQVPTRTLWWHCSWLPLPATHAGYHERVAKEEDGLDGGEEGGAARADH
eukprot:scaffold287368_cov18-Tisochrysis_lutea.AAC.1